jgi:hypothetical protein
MAKPLGPKSLLIRDAVNAHPDMGNTELAEMINASPARKEDKISVKPGDIAQQKQAMKKAGVLPAAAPAAKPARKKPGRKPGRKPAPAAPRVPSAASPVDLIDKALDLAQQCGGVAALKKLVDRLADMQRW